MTKKFKKKRIFLRVPLSFLTLHTSIKCTGTTDKTVFSHTTMPSLRDICPGLPFTYLNMFITVFAFFHSYELFVINLLVILDTLFLLPKSEKIREQNKYELIMFVLVPFIWSLCIHSILSFGSTDTILLKIAFGYNCIVLGIYSFLSITLVVISF
ncbi:uncharacterized protein CELE_Y105C5A.1269 [Caenorhabditis elegans]|uniref:Transmembrane protein n=1 Tax=Caenorhabditis elegans TaxID=6239 RepID=C5VUJ7_CAEEL|nr:Transmembrane protein [Caenorhabditis elegans]CAZ65534.1 Transmembrane protein [Caenorhabditis elegans]|eukprot:NP_001255880.1 Uncharacterized protein CELE_Y105C5A.1269 [Caenorhabditis elegans]